MTTQSEQTLENNLVTQLAGLGYEKVVLPDTEAMLANLKTQIEKHNNVQLSDSEFRRALNHLDKGNVFDRAKILRDKLALKRDNDKDTVYLEFINQTKWCQNQYQVAQQISNTGDYKNRYDVTLLVNGLPLVQIELKRRGIELKEAFNQVNRYRRHSYAANHGLFQYIQLFVISNGVNTKYYANSVSHYTGKKASFEQTFYWTDRDNQRISRLSEFADIFLEPCHISKMITKYIVLNESSKVLMVLRPYQYFAVERIIDKVTAHAGGGYIWHTTGSGKTLTSFKASQIMTEMPDVDQVLFVVDRNDLDYQTIREFNSFKDGSVDGTDNTKSLVRQLNDPTNKLIVTTIQKLDRAIRHERHANAMATVRDKRTVIIFDECHRSQFGDTHHAITEFFTNYQMFGFTGTPIFAKNAMGNGKYGKRTTRDLFGDCLHQYVITDAINDGNVLRFSVEYINTIKLKDGAYDQPDVDVSGIDTQAVMDDPNRIDLVTKYIAKHHGRKTFDKEFTALMCVSSVSVLGEYYKALKRNAPDLQIATIFSYAANEEDLDADGYIDETDVNMSPDAPVNVHSRDMLESAMQDYNQVFGTNYNTRDTASFYNYYKDIARRVRTREIDILLVVNMFLTGFDSKTLNTIYVDKKLRHHGLIQAYSRTNRTLNARKSQGNVVVFRNLKKETDEAIELFADKNANEVIFVEPYEHYVEQFAGVLAKLKHITPTFDDVDSLMGEQAKADFVTAFRDVLRAHNVLISFADFSYDDLGISEQEFIDYKTKYLDLYMERGNESPEKESILDEIDFEVELVRVDVITVDYILRLLARYVDASDKERGEILKTVDNALASDEKLRSKRELIEKFIESMLPNVKNADEVGEVFEAYWSEEQQAAIDKLCQEEGLDREKLQNLLDRYAYSGRKPRQHDLEKVFVERPKIRERQSVLGRLGNKLMALIRTFIDDA